MTLQEFQSKSIEEQHQIFEGYNGLGTFRDTENQRVMLKKVYDFYVEAYYDCPSTYAFPAKIHAFNNAADLEPYIFREIKYLKISDRRLKAQGF
jgi:hypothetical protein